MLVRLNGQGKTLIVSTHDVDFAYRWAERILVFQNGRLTANGTPPEIFSRDALCGSACLECPILLQIERILEKNNLLKEKGRSPRTVKELEQLLGR